MKKLVFIALSLFVFGALFTACESEEARKKREAAEREAEMKESLAKAGKELEKAGAQLGDDMEKALNNLGNSSEEVGKSLGEAMQQLGKSLEGISLKDEDGNVIEPVDHRELKELMPNKVLGMKRGDYEGQSSGVLGMNISTSSATYKDGDKKMKISLVDTGGLGLAMAAMADWSKLDIDKETSDGYERTTMINGNKAFESYNRKTEEGQIALITKDRFIVSAEFEGISIKEAKRVVGKINLGKLTR